MAGNPYEDDDLYETSPGIQAMTLDDAFRTPPPT